MTSISDMAVQVSGLSLQTGPTSPTASTAQTASVYDVAQFRTAWDQASTINMGPAAVAPTAQVESEGMRAMFSTLNSLNGRAEQLESKTAVFADGNRDMTPGEMLMLTVQSHEFLFHCELTANVANRTSDGIQQLFRQQS